MKGFVSMLGYMEFLNPFNYIMDIVNLIPKLVYFISATAMGLLDIAQMLIRKLAGLDVHYSADGDAQTGDIVLTFLQGIFGSDPNYAALRNAFWSLVILAIILLVVSTIIATIRQEYMPGQEESKEKPSNTKVHVINRAVKSMFMFLIVPVSVFVGLMFSDAILRAMDSVTSGAGSSALVMSQGVTEKNHLGEDVVTYPTDRLVAETMGDGQSSSYIYYDFFSIGVPTTGTPFSGFGFKAAGFSANRVRIGKTYKLNGESNSFYQLVKANNVSNFSIFNMANSEEEMALMIDDAFAGNVKLQTPQYLDYNSAANNDIRNPMLFPNLKVNRFTKYNVALVWYYYDLWQYNFVIAAAFLIVSLKIMIKIVMGLMKRIIELVALFIISPPIIALMPLDGGKSFGQWKNSFLSKALGVYGAIIGMNILFLLLPYINQIKFLSENVAFSAGDVNVYYHAAKMVNMVISTLFIITGLVMVDGLIALMSTVIGSDDIAKEGGELTEKVGDTLQSSLNRTAMAAGIAGKVATAPFTLARDGANAIGRKATGNKDFKIGGATMRGLGRAGKGMLKKISTPMNAGKMADIIDNQHKSWQNKDGEQEYDDYIKNSSNYKKDMSKSFDNRTDKNLDMDQWLASDEGATASNTAYSSASAAEGMQSKQDFLKAESGAGKKALNARINEALAGEASLYARLQQAGGYLKRKGSKVKDSRFGKTLGAAGRGIYSASSAVAREAYEVAGGLSSYSSNVYGAVEEALGRKGKQGYFKTMALSFQGKSEKEIENAKKKEDYKKEQLRKENYEKSKKKEDEKQTSTAKSGVSDSQLKDYVKKENVKLQTQMETDLKKEMQQYVEREQKDLKEQIKKQSEEISRLKKKK